MKKHKWIPVKLNVEAYQCEKFGCLKTAVSYNYGEWEYLFKNGKPYPEKSYNRPDCIKLIP